MAPSIFDMHDVLFDDSSCYRYLLEKDVFYRTLPCTVCGGDMERDIERKAFRCCARSCHKELSIRKHTFFFGSMLKTNQILLLGYLWVNRLTNISATAFTGFSKNTIAIFYRHFRQLVASTLQEDDHIIGGAGVVIEVDETKLGKRKYQRGHVVDGIWVAVGVERTADRRVFVVALKDRTADTLLAIVRKHVANGSIVHTDLFKSYAKLEEVTGLKHKTVNHSLFFKDPVTGVHTNTVEGTNFALKRQIPI
jgi:transposase-like protein